MKIKYHPAIGDPDENKGFDRNVSVEIWEQDAIVDPYTRLQSGQTLVLREGSRKILGILTEDSPSPAKDLGSHRTPDDNPSGGSDKAVFCFVKRGCVTIPAEGGQPERMLVISDDGKRLEWRDVEPAASQ